MVALTNSVDKIYSETLTVEVEFIVVSTPSTEREKNIRNS